MRRSFWTWRFYTWVFVVPLALVLTPIIVWAAGAAESAAEHHEAAAMPVTGKGQHPTAAQGVLDKPLTIKGTDIQLQFGGFVKVDFMYDVDPIGNADKFAVNSIPVDSDPEADQGGSANLSARQTRLDMDVRSNTPVGLMRAYVEGDFFGSGNAFRMRHAYGEWKGILGGQTWSTFQDISARPFTLDYEGPDAAIFVRQPQIRYTGHPADQFEWAVAIEDPDSQIDATGGVSGSGRSQLPDIPGYVRFKPEWGHLQVSGIVRQLRFVSDDGDIDESTFGLGLSLSGKVNILTKDALMGQFAFGSGIGRYIEVFGGTNSDAVVTPGGDVDALNAWGAVLGYTHHWSEQFNSTISGALADVDNDSSQPDDAIKSARSFHLNLVYAPFHLLSIGGEIMYGMRENKNGDDGDAVRLQCSIQYKFR